MLVDKDKVVRMVESVLESLGFSGCTDVEVVRSVSNLLYNVQRLDGVPSPEVVNFTMVLEGGMVLSPREVLIVKCFARAWDNSDFGQLLDNNVSYAETFRLMVRLGVEPKDFGVFACEVEYMRALAESRKS